MTTCTTLSSRAVRRAGEGRCLGPWIYDTYIGNCGRCDVTVHDAASIWKVVYGRYAVGLSNVFGVP